MLGDFVLPSLEVAGPGMHWVEVSRAVAAEGTPLSDDTKAMAEAYDEYFAAAGACDEARRDVPRRPHGRLARASSTAATTSATSPGTRSG